MASADRMSGENPSPIFPQWNSDTLIRVTAVLCSSQPAHSVFTGKLKGIHAHDAGNTISQARQHLLRHHAHDVQTLTP